MPPSPLRVAVLGLGPIGQAVAREILAAPDLRLAAAVDPAPALAGRDLAEILGDDRGRGVRVVPSLDASGRRRVDVAAHLAASRFPRALPHLRELVARGLPTASTCEELIAARYRWPREAAALDRAARRAGVAIVATGVNPGFVMDVLPAALANVCVNVSSVRIERHVDTSKRRGALQQKTGAGITAAEFRRRAKENAVGHVGLGDSLVFLMNHLPLRGEVGEETLRPILAARALGRGKATIPKGRVAGVHQTVRARDPAGRVVATFDLKMAYGLEDPHDEILLRGDPPIRLRIDGGVSGDRATVGAVLSGLRWVVSAEPGLA